MTAPDAPQRSDGDPPSRAAPTDESPYRPPAMPAHPLGPTGVTAASGGVSFDGRTGLSTFIVRLLGVHMLSMVLTALLLGYLLLRFWDGVEAGSASARTLAAASSASEAIVLLQGVLMILTGVAFVFWMRRKHGNLPALGARGLSYSRNWVTAAFFVPVMNLVRPFQVLAETWRASNPTLPLNEPLAWRTVGGHGLVALWWGLFLGVRIVDLWTTHAFRAPQDLDTWRHGMILATMLAPVWIGAAFATIALVRRLDTRQLERFLRTRNEAADGLDPLGAPAAPPTVPAEPHCPACLAPYRPEDYRADLEHIYCAHCRSELPR